MDAKPLYLIPDFFVSVSFYYRFVLKLYSELISFVRDNPLQYVIQMLLIEIIRIGVFKHYPS